MADELPMFNACDLVDVTSGHHIGDYGTVVNGPIDLSRWYVFVELERVDRRSIVSVQKLELRTSDATDEQW